MQILLRMDYEKTLQLGSAIVQADYRSSDFPSLHNISQNFVKYRVETLNMQI